MPAQDKLLEQGFQLACFIFPERSTALRILGSAMNKLKVQRGRENRRAYWRDKHLKRGITRITRDEADTLQWLIFYESEPYEKQQEGQSLQSMEEMVVRYIKTLVRASTAMSSFYVNIGIHRLLHSYSTAETQRLYETLTDRYLGADEYRRAKSSLMQKLLDRFGDLLVTERAPRGEYRFVTDDDQARWTELVDVCLDAFIPWSTAHACLVPRDFGAGPSQLPPQLSGKVSGPNRDQVEINRCHALIDPACDMRLLQALTFELPQEKLAVPRFHMTNARRDAGLSRKDSGLSEDERNSIQESLSQQRARRGKARPESARVTVDGTERARVQLTQRNKTAFVIQEGAELIELWGECEGEDLLLAVHPVAYAEAQIAAQNAVAFESRGRRLELAIVPEPPAGDALGRATVTLDSRPGLIGWLPQPTAWSWAAGQAVAAAVFLGIGWMLGARFPQAPPAPPLPASIATSIQPANAAEEKTAAQASSAAAHRYRLVPDELVTRGGQGPQLPFVSLPGENGVVSLELPIGQEHSKRSFRARMKRFEGRLEILTENLLSARPSGSGWVVDFPVPASLLHGNQDYSVDLLLHGPPGMVEELTSYTFHTK